MSPLLRHVGTRLTISAAAFGLLGGLTITLANHAPSERHLASILTSPQIEVDAKYLVPARASEFARHAVCRCGLRLGEDQIPPTLKQALLAKEDTRFYVHRGL